MFKKRFVGLLIFAYLLFTSRLCSPHPLCRAHERSSLLEFKASFAINKSAPSDPSAYSKVASWAQGGTTSNCCSWDGVECDEDTGHVISLDISSSFLYGNIDSNSSLFKLLHLQRLNLADNDFNHSQIPTAISNLLMLTSLDLSFSAFSGQIPSEISRLSHLTSLDLSSNDDCESGEGLLELKRSDFSSFIRNLTNLKELSMSCVNISSTVPTSLANFSSLTSLILKGCGLKGELPAELFQLPNLQILNVESNSFSGELPQFNQTSALKVLNLGLNSLSGVIPSIGNLTQLSRLVLGSNHFSGPIPLSFSKLINLNHLDLHRNHLSGTVDFDMFLRLKNLTELVLSVNNLSLLIKPGLDGPPPQYTLLDLSLCNLSTFPYFLRHQIRMEVLQLYGNHISGPIPAWLMNMSRPETFTFINLSGNSLTGELSLAICNFSSLSFLMLSGNKLVGELPFCLGNFSDWLSNLHLADNSFSGSIPTFAKHSQLRMLNLGYNQLRGKLPRSLANCKMLEFLSVENNQLNDVFPYWLGSLPELQILMLRSNKFHGIIKAPQTDLGFVKLRIIVMSYNNFTGMLPSNFIQNLIAMKSSSVGDLRYMQARYRQQWPSSGRKVTYKFSTTLRIKGVTRPYEEINDDISFIDLSNNNFGGEIPEVLGELNGLYGLDLSNNNLTGGIPSALAKLKALESLDLSRNKLSGRISPVLAKLTFLQYFNVSHNRLTGHIPPANQFATFGSSSYEGNEGLCGIPLPNKCANSEASGPALLPSFDEEPEDNSGSPFQFGWKAVAIGYGCAFIVGVYIGHVVVIRKSRWFAMTFRVKNLHVRRRSSMTGGN